MAIIHKKMRLQKKDLSIVTGIPARRLLDWTQRGYIEPDEKNPGQGRTSFYSPSNAVQAKVLEQLTRSGISLSKFSDIFRKAVLFTKYFDPYRHDYNKFNIKSVSLVVFDNVEKVQVTFSYDIEKGVSWVDNKTFEIKDYKVALIINLKNILIEVRKAIDAL